MLRVRISISTAALEQPLRVSLQSAMNMGAQGVQLDLRQEVTTREYGSSACRQLLHALHERGLQAASAHFPLRSPLAWKSHLDERLDALRQAMDLAAQLKIHTLTFRPGRVPDEAAAEAEDVLVALLQDLAAHGSHVGVIPTLIPGGESAEDLRRLTQRITTGPVLVDADLAGWIMTGSRPVHQLQQLHDLVGHVGARDAIRDADGPGREVPIGRGELDWDEIAAMLGEMDYQGWLNVSRTSGSDRGGDMSRGVKYLRQLFLLDEVK